MSDRACYLLKGVVVFVEPWIGGDGPCCLLVDGFGWLVESTIFPAVFWALTHLVWDRMLVGGLVPGPGFLLKRRNGGLGSFTL